MLKLLEQINEKIGRAVSWLTTVLVLFVCFDVFRRYLLQDSAAWLMEVEWHLFAMIFLLSAGFTLKHDKHVRVDLFYDKFSERHKALVNLVGTIVLLMPWCLILIYTSFDYARNSWMINEGSPDPGGLPARYIIKFTITAGFILLLFQAVVLAFRSFSVYKNSTT